MKRELLGLADVCALLIAITSHNNSNYNNNNIFFCIIVDINVVFDILATILLQ